MDRTGLAMKSQVILIAACLLVVTGLADETMTGRVIRVTAGDTFTLLNVIQRDYTEREDDTAWGFGVDVDLNPSPDKVPMVIHLAEIDAPEQDQPYGPEAKAALAKKILGKVVRVTYAERDRFNHIVGEVYLEERWINAEVLVAGCAWHDKRYSDEDLLDTAEQQARAGHVGLWAGAQPVPPWKWRQQHPMVTPED